MLVVLRDFLNGLAFGITETIPGVSGGTIAVILGFYDRLIETVNHFTEDWRKYTKFLLPFLLGMGSGLLIFFSIIHFLLTNYSLPTMSFFIGLITGIIPIIFMKVKTPGKNPGFKEAAQIILPVIFLVVISNLKGNREVNAAEAVAGIDSLFMVFIFFSGIIAAAALVIPGISGSFVLLLVGIYPLATYSVSSIRLLLADITNYKLMLDIVKVLGPLGIGIVIGGLSTARLIEKLLKNYYKTVYSIILGLLLGSVYALFNEPIVFQSGVNLGFIIISAVTFSLGCTASFVLGKKRL